MGRLLPPVGLVLVAAFVLSGCAAQTPTLDPVVPAPTPAVNPDSTSAASEHITFVSVVDGNTIETSAGTIQLIGIDTPERGECGDDEAAAAIESQLAPATR
ncbi:MAG: hypothetical protein ACTHNQ_18015 [Microbacterium sp.]|uniref:hypothetical protein n=1 Tax=Microbacterium sp. TaxID=51671 RepID=UPI003F7E1321